MGKKIWSLVTVLLLIVLCMNGGQGAGKLSKSGEALCEE